MAIELATQFQPYCDEKFTSESKASLVTNKDFSFDGAKAIKIYKVNSVPMEDFNRNGPILDGSKSQYGTIRTLNAATEEFTLSRDRSFSIEVDKIRRSAPPQACHERLGRLLPQLTRDRPPPGECHASGCS